MATFESRIEKLERRVGIGLPKLRFLCVYFSRREDEERELAKVQAQDEAENGPLRASERFIFVMYGPGGCA